VPVHVVMGAELISALFAMIVHGPVGMLDDALSMLGVLWRRVPPPGHAVVSRDIRSQLSACHHAAKKPRCARWFQAQLVDIARPAL
jgi:hypothetical protein